VFAGLPRVRPVEGGPGFRPIARSQAERPVDFFLFLLVNATLFIRPSEVDPDLAGAPIYNALILANLFLASGSVIRQLNGRELRDSPITACMLGLAAAIPLSHLTHGQFGLATDAAIEGLKLTLYYLLLVGVVSTPGRMRQFLLCLAGFTVVLTTLALLQFHDVIHIPSLESVGDSEVDPVTGQEYILQRLCSTGIYHDPNDLCTILSIGMAIGLFSLGDRRIGIVRYLWLAPLGLFFYAFTQTHSKGGFLALMSALATLIQARFGWRRALPLAALALPAMFLLLAGRQTNISAGEDTAQDRIQLWAEGFAVLRGSPLFGVGSNRFAEGAGLVVHNSFIQGYAELGMFGGTLFLAAFAHAFTTLFRLDSHAPAIADPEIRRLRPYLVAIMVAYSVGLLSVSRNYVVPTYMVLGISNAYLKIVASGAPSLVPDPVPRLDGRLAVRLGLLSVGFVVLANLFVKVFIRYG
jgi:putative inorganic carbon (HCO3(-)) transporter